MDDEFAKAIDEAVQRALEQNLDGALERAMKQMVKGAARKMWMAVRKAAFAIMLVALWFAASMWFPTKAAGHWLVATAAGILLLSLLAVADAVSRNANAAGSEIRRFSIGWMSPYLVGLAGFVAALLLGRIDMLASAAAALASLSLAFPALLPFMRGLWGNDVVKQLQQAYAEERGDVPGENTAATTIETEEADSKTPDAD